MKYLILIIIFILVSCSHSVEKSKALDKRLETITTVNKPKNESADHKVQDRINLYLKEKNLKQETENKLIQAFLEDVIKHEDSSNDFVIIKSRLSKLEKTKLSDLKILKEDVDHLLNRPIKKREFKNERRLNRDH